MSVNVKKIDTYTSHTWSAGQQLLPRHQSLRYDQRMAGHWGVDNLKR